MRTGELIVIALYFAAMLAIGFYAWRKSTSDVRGYMLWSLFDNLEWSLGYTKRFGMVHVNFATQERTPKDSAKLYSQVIATNGAVLND